MLKKIFLFSGLTLILYSVFFVLAYPKNQGAYFLALLGVFFVFYSIFRSKILIFFACGALKVVRLAITIAFSFVLVTFMWFCIYTAVISTHTIKDGKDAVIVLGAGLSGGYSVSLTLAKRLDKAVGYYEQNPDVIIKLEMVNAIGKETIKTGG